MKLARRGLGAWALPVLFLFPLSASGTDTEDLLFESLAGRWLERHSVTAEHRGGWSALLEERFAHLAVGLFDVRIPCASLGDPEGVKNGARAVQALLEAQSGWLAWARGETQVRGEKKAGEKKPKDDPLARWLDTWSPKTFAGAPTAGAELSELPGVPAAARSVLTELRSELRKGGALGFAREVPGVRLVLFPERAEFVEFVCVAGMLDPRLKASAHDQGLTTWLEYQAQDARFLCLEYGSGTDGRPLERGEGVADRNPVALAELVAQVGTRSLLARLYGAALDPALASGMANALVIDLYGELDTRIDGDVRSRSTEGRSVFVPGGNPDGGVLPASSAENRWRGTKGRDHFVGVLAQVQKSSGKKAPTRPERLTRFELHSDDGARKEIVSAPFLGPKAEKPASDLLADYLELVRCYGVAFLHWLRQEGAGEAPASAQRFAELLRSLARGAKAEELPRLLESLYGRPLSAASPDELFAGNTLEGSFLAWLAKQG